MRAGPPSQSHLSRIAVGICAVLVIATPVARGGVDLPAEAVVLTLAAVAALLVAFAYPFVSGPTLALGVVLFWMTFQLLPLPWQAHAISPGAATVFQLSLSEVGHYPAARPLALDLVAGNREVAKATACLLLVFASAALATTERRRALLLRALAGSAIVVACTVLGAALLGLGELLAPSFPFVNANHLAGFLELTGFLVLGHALQTKGGERALWAICFSGVVAVLMTTLSRGGILAFALGIAVFAAWSAKRQLVSPGARSPLVLGSVAAGLGAGAVLAVTPVLAQLGTLQTTPSALKMDLWRSGLRVLGDYPVSGIGRGAFTTVFQSYRNDLAQVTYTHLENEWLQSVIDLGLPFGVLLLGTLLWVWFAAARRAASTVELGLLVGMLCLGIHLLFDFSIEVLGVAVPFAVGLGVLMSHARRVHVPRTALVAFVIVACAVGLGRQLLYQRSEQRLSLLGRTGDEELSREGAEIAAERPADYLPHAIVGVRLAREGRCTEAFPWLRRAMLLSPMVPEPHAALGRCLAGGPFDAQAKKELGLAVSLGYLPALQDAVRIWPSLDDLQEIAGNSPDGLLALAKALSPERGPEAQVVLDRLRDEFLDDRSTLPLAHTALRNGDSDAALEAARHYQRIAPGDVEGYRIAGHVLAQRGEALAARAEIEKGLQSRPGSAELISVIVAREVKDRRYAEARRLARQISPLTPRDLALRHTLLAKILLAESRVPEAVGELEAATVATPDDPSLHVFLAEVRERDGRIEEAIAALERAAALPGAPAEEIASRLARLRGTGGKP